ncbi:MAG: T9SS type A sorting domain-containing protein, partial [Candidatus Azobacteroides sp.]|nr:T9SS type A sorting domain-containing protein [Candidatus Azobacteroides sp.]
VVTHDVRYLNEAKAMTDIVLAKDYKKGAGFNEVSYWGGNAVIDLLCELYEQDPDPKWYNAAKDIVDFLIDKSRDKRGFYPAGDKGTWNRVGTNVYPLKTINTISQACAAHAILRFAYLDMTYGKPNSIPRVNADMNKPVVYPNPVRDMLNIQNVDQNAQVEVFTISGAKIIQNRGTSIDVSSIPSGIYVIRINTGTEVYTSKFVKE